MKRHAPAALVVFLLATPGAAQNAPTRQEIAIYAGLHEAAAKGDVAEIEQLLKEGEKPDIQDSKSRTPLHVAAYLKQHAAARALLKGGANPNALEIDRYHCSSRQRPGDAQDRARRWRKRAQCHEPL
jgi:uncharacterized protein